MIDDNPTRVIPVVSAASPLCLSAMLLITSIPLTPARAAPRQRTIDVATMKEYLLAGFEANKTMDLAIADAMPDSALRWSPHEGMRDFAQQLVHTSNNYWIAPGLDMVKESYGDSTTYLTSRADLAAGVERAYDWVLDHLRDMPPGALTEVHEFFGTPTPVWRVYMMAIQHSTWTRGQMVPYFHAHNVRVPRFRLF